MPTISAYVLFELYWQYLVNVAEGTDIYRYLSLNYLWVLCCHITIYVYNLSSKVFWGIYFPIQHGPLSSEYYVFTNCIFDLHKLQIYSFLDSLLLVFTFIFLVSCLQGMAINNLSIRKEIATIL